MVETLEQKIISDMDALVANILQAEKDIKYIEETATNLRERNVPYLDEEKLKQKLEELREFVKTMREQYFWLNTQLLEIEHKQDLGADAVYQWLRN